MYSKQKVFKVANEIYRAVGKEDTLSPKIYSVALKGIFKRIVYGNIGININRVKLKQSIRR